MNWVVIMAGGGGTRLWPVSRRRRPKQFLPLLPGGETLLAATVRRLHHIVPLDRTLIVTAASQVDEVRRVVPVLPIGNVVVEPEGRNTAPAIGLSTVEVLRRDPDAVVAVLPSDQFVRDEERFRAALTAALDEAAAGRVAVIGIRPNHPETGFGYVQAAPAADPTARARRVLRFVEKPDPEKAAAYLRSGDYSWNAGMFFFRAARMLDEIRAHLPALGALLDDLRADPARTAALYPHAPKISIDYAVMERLPASGDLVVVEGDFGWSDVGSFAALADVLPRDADGNVTVGDVIAVDARDNVILGGTPEAGEVPGRRLVAAVGVSGLCVVVTDDAVLVLPRDRAQDVRRVVDALEKARREPYL